ncbi:MAG: nucleotidyltransferase family protein [Alphaproteobacteria bacterium]|nr:nucleotidyltransferase family protein [Alphaproteobacteria bacterium]
MIAPVPRTGMVFAAGRGTRMHPLTKSVPKPLIRLCGKSLIDYSLDRLVEMDVPQVVVNVHYLADQICAHLSQRRYPQLFISDERPECLDTGGGLLKALPFLGSSPFFILNSDVLWIEKSPVHALRRLSDFWDSLRMDMVILLSPPEDIRGYSGLGDFILQKDGRVRRRREDDSFSPVYMGVGIVHPRLFSVAPSGAFSLNLLFDHMLTRGRLFGYLNEGICLHVGTPEGLDFASAYLASPIVQPGHSLSAEKSQMKR